VNNRSKSAQKSLRVPIRKAATRRKPVGPVWPSDDEQTIAALRAGGIDALVIRDGRSDNVYALKTFQELEDSNAKLRESQQRLVELVNERERLMQDLHDGCIQSIYAVGLSLQGCRKLVKTHPAKAAERIAHAAASLNLVIQELRSFISENTPQDPPLEMQTELERIVQTIGAGGPSFDIDIDGKVAKMLPGEERLQLLQIAREGLSNIVRHAHATSGRIALWKRNGCIRLEVSDNGRGFDPKINKGPGLGLHHIAARVQKLGARLELFAAPNEGTRILVEIRSR
jgi:signal transduction histidine kinase